jgi:hypothetical protein
MAKPHIDVLHQAMVGELVHESQVKFFHLLLIDIPGIGKA